MLVEQVATANQYLLSAAATLVVGALGLRYTARKTQSDIMANVVGALEKLNGELRQEIHTARDETAALRVRITELESERLRLIERIRGLEQQLSIVVGERDRLRDELAGLTAEIAVLRQQLADLGHPQRRATPRARRTDTALR